MTLLAIGFSPNSKILSRAIKYLVNIDKEEILSFFWRAGPLLNLPDYQSLVKEDMEYIWQFKRRVGVHKDYPIPFFLLKLIRFINKQPSLSFSKDDVLRWILDEWIDDNCWYDRTSITSMALALIYDLRFKNKTKIISLSKQFLQNHFTEIGSDTGTFSGHLVDDCFTVYNLCERPFLDNDDSQLSDFVAKTVVWIESHCIDQTHWESSPPFGGSISPYIYPTAVAVRALLSYYVRIYPHFLNQVASILVEQGFTDEQQSTRFLNKIKPFWGEILAESETNTCFVLMPFQPRKLTEIYQKYIKEPIESKTNLQCIRADDIYKPTEIMRDIWEQLNRAKLVIADLTNKNPNVFYELGMAHVLGKHVILIAQSTEDIPPFDLRGIRTIIYEDSLSGYEYLSKQVLMYVSLYFSIPTFKEEPV